MFMNIEDIKKEIEKDLESVKDLKELNELHIKYLSKKGIITELNSKIKDVPNDKKKEFGMEVNSLRNYFNENYNAIKERLESECLIQLRFVSRSFSVDLSLDRHAEIQSDMLATEAVEELTMLH